LLAILQLLNDFESWFVYESVFVSVIELGLEAFSLSLYQASAFPMRPIVVSCS
jgi:hypothetical protein